MFSHWLVIASQLIEKRFYYLASYAGFSYEVLRMYGVDKRSAVLKNAAGFARRPSTSCTGVCLAITMLQYYICLGVVLTVVLVLGLGLGFGIISYFVIGT